MQLSDLKAQYDDMARDNEHMRRKLKFLEANDEMSKLNEIDIDEFKNERLRKNSTYEATKDEKFDNKNLEKLKSGETMLSADELMGRNSQYPTHLRSAYAIGSLDKDVNELEMKSGYNSSASSLQRTLGSFRSSKIPTPKQSHTTSVYQFEEQSSVADKKQGTPSRFKKIFSRKDKDEVSINSLINSSIALKFNNNSKNSRRLSKKLRPIIKNPASSSSSWRKRKMDDDDSDEKLNNKNKVHTMHQELKRKEKRRSVQDYNRPNLNEELTSSSDTIIADDDDDELFNDDFDDYKEEFSQKANTSRLDKSIEYLKSFEDHQKRQQKLRRNTFNLNRRNSGIRLTTHLRSRGPILLRSPSTNELEKFQSCLSLRSEGSFSEDFPPHRLKTIEKNFINLHVAQVSRISDIFVPQTQRQLNVDINDKYCWDFRWKDVAKPMPIIIIILLTLAFLSIISFIARQSNDSNDL